MWWQKRAFGSFKDSYVIVCHPHPSLRQTVGAVSAGAPSPRPMWVQPEMLVHRGVDRVLSGGNERFGSFKDSYVFVCRSPSAGEGHVGVQEGNGDVQEGRS